MKIHHLGKIIVGLVAIASCALAFEARADDRDVAVSMVKKAIQFYKANGAEKFVEEAGNAKGQFVDGAVYVYVMDSGNTMLAHPMNPRLAGQNTGGVLDADGRPLNKLIYESAGQNGSGWVEYRFKNPTTGDVEPKLAYIEKVDDLYVVSGIYKKQ